MNELRPDGPMKDSLSPREPKRLYWLWWFIGPLLQVLLMLPWVRRKVHARALGITMLIFVLLMVGIEMLALHFHWWIWNESILLGIKVGLIPLEEFLIFLICVPALVIMQAGFLSLWQKYFRRK